MAYNNTYNRNEYIPETNAFSESCRTAENALTVLLIELEGLSRSTSVSAIKHDINRAITIHNKAARIYYTIHYRYDDIKPIVNEQLVLLYGRKNIPFDENDTEIPDIDIPSENDIDEIIKNVDELHGFIMNEYANFIESVKVIAISQSRPDILKYLYNKIKSSKKLKSPRKTQRAKSANRASRKKHSSRKRRHSAK